MNTNTQSESVGSRRGREVGSSNNGRGARVQKGLLLAVVGATAFAAPSARAQQFTFAAGDVLAAFHKAGSPDLEVNLGKIDTLLAAPGPVSFGGTSYDITTQLLGNFGNNLDGLSFSVIAGTKSTLAGHTANETWLSYAGTASAGPANFGSLKSASVASQVDGIAGTGTATAGARFAAAGASYPPSSASAIIIPSSSANSFSVLYPGTTHLAGLLGATASTDNTTGAGFTGGATPLVSGFYDHPGTAAATTAGALVGTFSLDGNGQLTFTPVPEPSTYALAGLGLGVLFLIQRRRAAHQA
ncbi:MAG TPA: hypothetical protein DCM86_02295 [Verrucomicrobiales bacterium]|nr:hypothetical protein [Verrucomicrobiales bacterium]